jgi:acyl-CoA thioesterase-1
VLGDSLTSGHGIGQALAFPAVLQQYLDANDQPLRVVNAGVSGDTSAGGLRRLPAALAGDVRLLVVALGVNDGLRGVPVGQIQSNLNQIIGEARRRKIPVLLCAMEALPIYGWDYTFAFRRMYRDLADQYGIPLVPFMLMQVIGNAELMQPDRMHPNAAGARAMATVLWPHLKAILSIPES